MIHKSITGMAVLMLALGVCTFVGCEENQQHHQIKIDQVAFEKASKQLKRIESEYDFTDLEDGAFKPTPLPSDLTDKNGVSDEIRKINQLNLFHSQELDKLAVEVKELTAEKTLRSHKLRMDASMLLNTIYNRQAFAHHNLAAETWHANYQLLDSRMNSALKLYDGQSMVEKALSKVDYDQSITDLKSELDESTRIAANSKQNSDALATEIQQKEAERIQLLKEREELIEKAAKLKAQSYTVTGLKGEEIFEQASKMEEQASMKLNQAMTKKSEIAAAKNKMKIESFLRDNENIKKDKVGKFKTELEGQKKSTATLTEDSRKKAADQAKKFVEFYKEWNTVLKHQVHEHYAKANASHDEAIRTLAAAANLSNVKRRPNINSALGDTRLRKVNYLMGQIDYKLDLITFTEDAKTNLKDSLTPEDIQVMDESIKESQADVASMIEEATKQASEAERNFNTAIGTMNTGKEDVQANIETIKSIRDSIADRQKALGSVDAPAEPAS